MKASHAEGLATHSGPESCVGAGDCAGEALTGEVQAGYRAAKSMPRESGYSGVPTPWRKAEGKTGRADIARHAGTPRGHRTPCMHGSASHGNREVPRLSAAIGAAERIGNPKGSRR
jgi:RNA-directed DNA polymerase